MLGLREVQVTTEDISKEKPKKLVKTPVMKQIIEIKDPFIKFDMTPIW
jgi:hypothetical protein